MGLCINTNPKIEKERGVLPVLGDKAADWAAALPSSCFPGCWWPKEPEKVQPILISTPAASPDFFSVWVGAILVLTLDYHLVTDKGPVICISRGLHTNMTFPTLSILKAREKLCSTSIKTVVGEIQNSYVAVGSWPILNTHLCSLGWKTSRAGIGFIS